MSLNNEDIKRNLYSKMELLTCVVVIYSIMLRKTLPRFTTRPARTLRWLTVRPSYTTKSNTCYGLERRQDGLHAWHQTWPFIIISYLPVRWISHITKHTSHKLLNIRLLKKKKLRTMYTLVSRTRSHARKFRVRSTISFRNIYFLLFRIKRLETSPFCSRTHADEMNHVQTNSHNRK